MTRSRLIAATTITLLAAGPAFAHTGLSHADGLVHGLAHPFGGVDHLLAMVAVGLIAAHVGGRALWQVPLAFMAVMAAGAALGAAGLSLPCTEVAIAASVAVLGAAVALRVAPPAGFAMALVGAFALFHGQAHGAEMPASSSGLAYGLGFLAATAMLHAVGVAVGSLSERTFARRAVQVTGCAMMVVGAGLLAGAV